MAMEARTMDSAFHGFIVDYEQAQHLAIGVAIHSNAFSVGGHMWRVNLYPRGSSEPDNGQYLSIYFELLNITMTTRVSTIFEVFFIDKDGQPSPTAQSNVQLFEMAGGGVWGWNRFISVADLEEMYVTEGNIRFVCSILVVNDSSIPVPPSSLGKHLGTLLDNADGTDVSFIIDGQIFHAHRAVLAARSPVFRAELLGSMAEAIMPSITLQGIAPEIFKFMLQFIYTDALPEDDDLGDFEMRMETLMQLLAAADLYALDQLKLLCAKKLWDNMTLDTVVTTLGFADMHNCPELKNKCFDFLVSSNDWAVHLTYFDLVLKFPHLIGELQQKLRAQKEKDTIPSGPYM